MEHKGRFFLTTALLVMILVAASVSASFSYLGATSGNSNVEGEEDTQIQGGTLQVNSQVFNFNKGAVNAGESIYSYTFPVIANISSSSNYNYEIDLNISNNTYAENTVFYTITSTNTSSNGIVIKSSSVPVAIPVGTSVVKVGNGSFSGPVKEGTHTYTINIYRSEFSATFEGDTSAISGNLSVVESA